ncbi:hypothetical protein BT96DRAFT_921529 [Gymnopus androsaceus JB14]|uniref:Uncharacterized protein n=1 Tax=Gymnopus androsaceus JB14 TaxID=1447944 RepID=A0A6A4HIU9_9AGAR|nr:hypothetical protein BT96DRAFT_921529 [Gymnopus androsaceus JB14]
MNVHLSRMQCKMLSSLRSILVGFCSGYDIAQTHQKPSPLKANLMRRFMSLPRAQRLIAQPSMMN